MRSLLHRFDRRVTKTIQAWPDAVRPWMEAATTLAHPIVVLAIAGVLLWPDWELPRHAAAFAGWTVIATLGVGAVLKLVLRRRRPITYIVRKWFSTFSFPSGHTTGATAAYGALAVLGISFMTSGLLSGVLAVFCLALVALVGVSRVYLGAHYPSDVVAGWLLGLAGVIAFGVWMAA
jgi:undecaprenyl-diphosphatase